MVRCLFLAPTARARNERARCARFPGVLPADGHRADGDELGVLARVCAARVRLLGRICAAHTPAAAAASAGCCPAHGLVQPVRRLLLGVSPLTCRALFDDAPARARPAEEDDRRSSTKSAKLTPPDARRKQM